MEAPTPSCQLVLVQRREAVRGGGISCVEGDVDLDDGEPAAAGRCIDGRVAVGLGYENDVDLVAVGFGTEDDQLTLRRSRDDGRPLHAERFALEIDVVQLVAVQESAARVVADDRVVLP